MLLQLTKPSHGFSAKWRSLQALLTLTRMVKIEAKGCAFAVSFDID